jgi:hypothetical protein
MPAPATPTPTCRVCGCTDDDACLVLDAVGDRVGCSWVEPDLCSACVGVSESELRAIAGDR